MLAGPFFWPCHIGVIYNLRIILGWCTQYYGGTHTSTLPRNATMAVSNERVRIILEARARLYPNKTRSNNNISVKSTIPHTLPPKFVINKCLYFLVSKLVSSSFNSSLGNSFCNPEKVVNSSNLSNEKCAHLSMIFFFYSLVKAKILGAIHLSAQ